MGQVDARLPLALLRAMQQQDMPPELLPDEPVGSFFPNRLGLSDVVEDQIRQLEGLARKRRRVDEARASALLELIVRRVDAAAVLGAAGESLARDVMWQRAGFLGRFSQRMPPPLRRRAAQRALRESLPDLLSASEILMRKSPLEVRARDAITARVGGYSGACQLFSSAIAATLELFHAGAAPVTHPSCQRRGDEACVWSVDSG